MKFHVNLDLARRNWLYRQWARFAYRRGWLVWSQDQVDSIKARAAEMREEFTRYEEKGPAGPRGGGE